MSRFAAIIAAAIIVAATTLSPVAVEGHRCIHDTPEMQRLLHDDHVIEPQRYRGFKAQAFAPIRIRVFTLDLQDPQKYCTAAGDTRPNFQGGTVQCTADDVFTTAKRDILVNRVIPAAVAKLQRFLQVDSVVGNLVVPSNACRFFSHDPSHAAPGVSDADFVLYVAAGPTSVGNLAWAGTCVSDSRGRPVVGRANFGPAYIEWSDTNPTINDGQVATAVHELLHALGFSGDQFDAQYLKQVQLRGKTARIYTHPEVVSAYRQHIGCATAEGPEIEDEGGAGSAGSHWDRRVLKDELMAAAGGETFSVMTLAAMKASGHYNVDYTVAEAHPWGKGAGCSFITEKCNTVGGGLNKYFCLDESKSQACTWDYKGIGACSVSTYSSALPTAFQYFSNPNLGGQEFLDRCPVVQPFSNLICTNNRVRTKNEVIYGHYFGSGSRCLDTVGPLTDAQYVQQGATRRCLQVRCPSGSRIQVRVEGSAWIDCPMNGQPGEVAVPSSTGYRGSIRCPAAASFCDAEISIDLAAPVTPAPPTPAPFVVPPPTPAPLPPGQTSPATPRPTATDLPLEPGEASITGRLIITGDSWPSLITDSVLSTEVQNALRQDLAAALSLSTTKIDIVGMTTIGNRVSVTYVIVGMKALSPLEVNATLAARLGTTAVISNAAQIYATQSATPPRLVGTDVDAAPPAAGICGSSYTPAECNMIVTVVVSAVAVISLLLLLLCCCCREGREYIPKPPGDGGPY